MEILNAYGSSPRTWEWGDLERVPSRVEFG